ncbi:MAG: MoaD/ThiS family protein [Desulfobacterota bacterium]|jgi:molybdopterin converting factor small subunit|nr:MoaD/ThiS family protein [Thermodesulfobacteriota bacterium]
MDIPGTGKTIIVKINTTFAIGNTEAFGAQFDPNGDLLLELAPGTTVEELLLRLPGLGAPENWSDLFLHVFVNHQLAPFDRVLEDRDVLDIHIPLTGG